MEEREEMMNVDSTRKLHFNWQVEVWRYLTLDFEEDEFQQEETDEVSSLLLFIRNCQSEN